MPVEFWTSGRGLASSDNPTAFTSARQAQRAEELGFDGITRFFIPGATLDPSHPDSECSERFVSDVAPQLRR